MQLLFWRIYEELTIGNTIRLKIGNIKYSSWTSSLETSNLSALKVHHFTVYQQAHIVENGGFKKKQNKKKPLFHFPSLLVLYMDSGVQFLKFDFHRCQYTSFLLCPKLKLMAFCIKLLGLYCQNYSSVPLFQTENDPQQPCLWFQMSELIHKQVVRQKGKNRQQSIITSDTYRHLVEAAGVAQLGEPAKRHHQTRCSHRRID